MKRILCAVLAAAVCSSALISLSGCSKEAPEPGYKIEATEPDLEEGQFGYFIINSSELMITQYSGEDKDVVIPSTYNNYTVTTIGTSAFTGTDITSVTMPDTITDIKDYAFSSCTKLTSVNFSENLETVGDNAFYLCTSLENILIPASVKDLGMYTFSGSGIKSAEISEGNLKSLDHFVFYQCPNLTEITIPSTVKEMQDDSIADCTNYVTVKAPSGSYAEKYAEKQELGFEALN